MACVTVLVVAAAALLGGCGGGDVQPDGAWTGCGDVHRVDRVSVHRSITSYPTPGPAPVPLKIHATDATVVRAVYLDFCRAVGHPEFLHGPTSCPVDIGLHYTGQFYNGRAGEATFDWAASGCESLSISAGDRSAGTDLVGSALAGSPRLDPDFASLLGISIQQVHDPFFAPGY